MLIALALLLAAPQAKAEPQVTFPVCGIIVGKKYQAEVRQTGTYDKFLHCSLSCIITKRCGPIDSFETGVLKELHDALGYGDPDIEDLRADNAGTQIGISRDIKSHADCYRACDKIYPKNSQPPEKF